MGVNIEKLKQVAVPLTDSEKKAEREREETKAMRRHSAMIALAIRRELRLKGITQQAFAEQLGVSAQYLGKILKGKENLTLETIGKIEGVLGRSLIEVVVGEREEPKQSSAIYVFNVDVAQESPRGYSKAVERKSGWAFGC